MALRNQEGYLMIDNRNSPGVSDDIMVAQGMPVGSGMGMYESATYTCSHCNSIVVIEPKRTRDRGFCRKCSQRICDGCTTVMALTLECVPMSMKIDLALEQAIKGDK
jgi:phage terminase large subunit GpA-like protein